MNSNKYIGNNEKGWMTGIIILSVFVVGIVGYLLFQPDQSVEAPGSWVYTLPALNAGINTVVTLLLLLGYYFIRTRQQVAHQYTMISAFSLSVLFLISYLTYHNLTPHTTFGGEGAIRYVYFFVLITHIFLAIFIIPMALITLFRAFQSKWVNHRRMARITLPVWLYVSITGVLIYLMISPYYPV